MLRPSAAPRWKMTTSFLPWDRAEASSPKRVRVRNAGTAEAPTTAIAPFFMNIRRVIGIGTAPEEICLSVHADSGWGRKLRWGGEKSGQRREKSHDQGHRKFIQIACIDAVVPDILKWLCLPNRNF